MSIQLMQNGQSTLIVIGADSRQGFEWLKERFPSASRRTRALVLQLHKPEIDAILWAEELRHAARRDGVRVSIGLAKREVGSAVRDAAQAAGRAFQRAFSLGGDITVAHSTLLQAA